MNGNTFCKLLNGELSYVCLKKPVNASSQTTALREVIFKTINYMIL